jgi:hypothetical protein
MYLVDLENNERSCEYSAIQYVAKSIATYKHNEQINIPNIDNSECFGIKFINIYPEMTSQ